MDQLQLEKKLKNFLLIWEVEVIKFFKKWGITINFFEKFYLKSGLDKNKELIFNEYKGELSFPKKNLLFIFELLKCKYAIVIFKINKL